MTDSVEVPLSLRARWIGISLAIGAGLLVSLLMIQIAPSAKYSIKKSYLPLRLSSHAVSARDVHFITKSMLLDTPYTKLGTVTLTLHSLTQDVSKERAIESVAKSLAAQHGANALLVREFGHTGQVSSRWAGYRFSADAVYIPLAISM